MARSNRNSGKGGSLLDIGVAALAALSSGFVVYAMPEGLFSRAIVASRLPQFLAAAQPPLGMKARLAVIVLVALVVYAFVWSLMCALDNIGTKPRPSAKAAFEEEAPRLRRADAHPDAPSRRPIFAGRDLGEPDFDDEVLDLEPKSGFEPELAHDAEPAAAALPAFLVPQEPEPQTAEEAAPAEPVAEGFDTHPEQTEEVVEDSFHRFEEVNDRAGESLHSGHQDFEGEGEEEEASGAEQDDVSLTHLMQRFESGLTRKQQALAGAPRVPQAEAEPVPQERVGHRLRAAISGLNDLQAPRR
jgi:hypothetical protein